MLAMNEPSDTTRMQVSEAGLAQMRAVANRYGLLLYRVPDVLLAAWGDLSDSQRARAIETAGRWVGDGTPQTAGSGDSGDAIG